MWLVAVFVVLGYLGAQRVHETGHWMVLQLYGRDPVWGFTRLVQLDRPPKYPDDWVAITAPNGQQWLHLSSAPETVSEWASMLLAGQIAQFAAVITGFIVFHRCPGKLARFTSLALVLINSIGQVSYHIMSMLRGWWGDEGALAYYLGVPLHFITVPLASASAVGAGWGLYVLKRWRLRLKWSLAIFLGMGPLGLLMSMMDEVIITQLDLRNLLFQPVLGFSLPVVITDAIFFSALAVLLTRLKNHFLHSSR